MENEENKDIKSKFVVPTSSQLAIDISHIDDIVNNFLSEISFNRTFPLDLINLTNKMGGYKLFYLQDSPDDTAEAIIDPQNKRIALNARFKKDFSSYLCGRYIICKMIAHIALNHIPKGKGWKEPRKENRVEEDILLNPITAAFAYELLMPKKDFEAQWNNLGQDIKKLSSYFAASQVHIIERKCYLFKENNNA